MITGTAPQSPTLIVGWECVENGCKVEEAAAYQAFKNGSRVTDVCVRSRVSCQYGMYT